MSSLENSIPMTTTLMNRMNKRKDAAAVPKYYVKHQRLSDPDPNHPTRKVSYTHCCQTLKLLTSSSLLN